MNLNRLDRSLRENLTNLLQGYLEHCEVSRHLMARIDFPIYYHGFKFGAPVFTHAGPLAASENPKVIGLIGLNDPTSHVASEVLLQFIEILSQQPRLADASILRILPVANPVAMELGDVAPAINEWSILDHLVSQFHEQSPDGVIEVTAEKDGEYSLTGEASPPLFAALEEVRASIPRDSDRLRVLVPENIALKPVAADSQWILKLNIPRSWTGAPEVHAISRFIARLIRTHIWLNRDHEPKRSQF